MCCGSLDLYADDLAVMADSLEECIAKLKVWNTRDCQSQHEEDEDDGLGTGARPSL